MDTPFPYFGSKEAVAQKIWDRFGKVEAYVEPFFGSGRVLFNSPYVPNNEVINDANFWVSNFWRAIKKDPEQVAHYCDYPVSEIDQHARGDYLYYRHDVDKFKESMLLDPEFCDPKSAGWWAYGMSTSIMGSFTMPKRKFKAKKRIQRSKPQVSGGRRGVARYGLDGDEMRHFIFELSERLRYVAIMCGDWSRAVSDSVLKSEGITAIFFDPPYGNVGRSTKLYGKQDDTIVATDVMNWCKKNEGRRYLRIAVCGYESEHHKLKDWDCLNWSTSGGMNNVSRSKDVVNRHREKILFSPSCLREPSLFDLFSSQE